MLRLRNVTFSGWADSPSTALAATAPLLPCFCCLFLVEEACKAFLLPFWDNCIALVEL
jgi:hypothetical protein